MGLRMFEPMASPRCVRRGLLKLARGAETHSPHRTLQWIRVLRPLRLLPDLGVPTAVALSLCPAQSPRPGGVVRVPSKATNNCKDQTKSELGNIRSEFRGDQRAVKSNPRCGRHHISPSLIHLGLAASSTSFPSCLSSVWIA